jgi:hypothetical protein
MALTPTLNDEPSYVRPGKQLEKHLYVHQSVRQRLTGPKLLNLLRLKSMEYTYTKFRQANLNMIYFG